MVVLTGLAIVGLAAVSLELSASRLSSNISSSHVARMGARMKLDEIRSGAFEQLVSAYDGTQFDVDIDGDGAPDLHPQRSSAHAGTVQVQPILFGKRGGEAVRIIVEIRWRSRSGNQSYRLCSMRSRS
jgi:hypothetical protein